MSAEIDWEQQWSYHAYDFRGGKAHIPLTSEITLKLEPGPGFGDFSHPTTRLMIEMMRPYVAEKAVFDIGCGSGILSIAAALQGAKPVYICDIDEAALDHAMQNASLNRVSLLKGKPKESHSVVLMNMIASEQTAAWTENRIPFSTLITSGILAEEGSQYRTFAAQNGWKVVKEFESEGWLGYIFKENLT